MMETQGPIVPEEDEQSRQEVVPTSPAPARVNPLATLIVGLVIGLVVGYAGRPLITPVPEVSTPARSAPFSARSGIADPPPTSVAPATLLDTVIRQTRHFKGNPDAPVTMIEFSDFQ